MRLVDLTELRTIQQEILDDVDRFCKDRGLHYSLGGGTLLGAVRHKGYIPWDDDIDINMPRTDYEAFASSFRSDQNEVIDLRYHPACREICLKVVRKGTRMVDVELGRCLWGINIDIFPIDGYPNDDLFRIIANITGCSGFVGNPPLPLTEKEIKNFGIEMPSEIVVPYKIGDTVQIIDENFAGVSGVVKNLDLNKQVADVSVSMFGRETMVELKLEDIIPIN